MESRTRPGGSGFTTLTYRNARLAYLQVVRDTPPMPYPPGAPELDLGLDLGKLTMRFYEPWNESLWEHVSGGHDLYGGLRLHHRYGNIRLRKIVRSPSGIMRAREYHVVGWRANTDEFFTIAGRPIPMEFSVDYSHTTVF